MYHHVPEIQKNIPSPNEKKVKTKKSEIPFLNTFFVLRM